MITVKLIELPGSTTPEQMAMIIEGKVEELSIIAIELADQAAEVMRNFIRTTSNPRLPSSGKLVGGINVHAEEGTTEFVAGVGKIEELPVYWYVQNYGAYYDSPETPFIPGGGRWAGGSFNGERPDSAFAGKPGGAGVRFDSDGAYGVRAKNPIQAKLYIEKTVNWLNSYWEGYVNGRIR